MAVRVVNAYEATSERVLVTLERKVDLPTDGNPTREMRASPLLLTSKPEPPPEPAPGAGSSNWARRRASLLVVEGVSFARAGAWNEGIYPFNKPR